ncbi:MAG: ADOP family duplicated permease [Longimicrobiales bacterium]
MSWWTELRERGRGFFRTGRADRELDEELRFHMEMDVAARVRAGQDAEQARRASTRAFGGIDRYRSETRDARGVRPLEDFVYDVRHALRGLRHNLGFTAAAVLVLALGIGANTSIFSAVNAVVLRPLPFPQPERLYMLWEENAEKNWYKENTAPANLLDWRERVPAFADVAGYTAMGQVVFSGRGEPRAVGLAQVTGNFFSVLGVPPLHGRALRWEETWDAEERLVVISERFWRGALGASTEAVNSKITLEGLDHRVVGIMPARFAYPAAEVDVWLPTRFAPASRAEVWFRQAHWMRGIARLRPGVSEREANAQLQTVVGQLQREHPATNRGMGAGMTPLHEFLIGNTRKPLLLLMGAVGLLLLIGCANVGNLLLVKAASRQRELAVRNALGANRFRLIRQLLTESLALAVLGGAAGLLLGVLGTKFLISLQPEGLMPSSSFGADGRVLAFVTIVTLGCGLVFGAVPAAWVHRASAVAALKAGGRTGALGRSARTVAGSLVVAEIAVALILVVGAGLLVRSFQQLLRVHPGFDARGVLAVTLRLPHARYDKPEKTHLFYERLVERAAGLSGVEDAAATSALPLRFDGNTNDFVIAGRAPNEYGTEVVQRVVTPNYLRTMRVPLLRGRDISAADRKQSLPVVVINEALASKFFANRDPIGQRLAFERVPDSTSVWYTIVGVAANERQRGVALEPQIEVLQPYTQEWYITMHIVLRTAGDPMSVLPDVRRLVLELDPNLPILAVRSMEAVRDLALARERFLMALLLLFATVAFVLAVVGVYGVTAQFMRQRTQEIGVRLALGASSADVLLLMVRRGGALVASGVALGLLGALAGTRVMEGLLFNVKPVDAITFVTVAGTLAAAAIVAAWLPARRASRVEPLIALRPE